MSFCRDPRCSQYFPCPFHPVDLGEAQETTGASAGLPDIAGRRQDFEEFSHIETEEKAHENKAEHEDFEGWVRQLSMAQRLCMITDLDGTLTELGDAPELAVPSEETKSILHALSRLGVHVTVCSGRPKALLNEWFKKYPTLHLVAEHGAWVREDSAWSAEPQEEEIIAPLNELVQIWNGIAARYVGCLLEKKTLGAGLHTRLVLDGQDSLVREVGETADKFVAEHPLFERIDGKRLFEVRLKTAHKGKCVMDLKKKYPDARMLIMGDDLADEDMFREAKPGDACIFVGDGTRPTLANFNVPYVRDAIAVLKWLVELRSTAPEAPLPSGLEVVRTIPPADLLVISNRMPAASDFTRKQQVGGLVSALSTIFSHTRAVWLGWSGTVSEKKKLFVGGSSPCLASFDLDEQMKTQFYDIVSNGVLWPLLHSMHERMLANAPFLGYSNANMLFAQTAIKLVPRHTPIWVHDYHLMLVGAQLRELGHKGPIGFFLHVPFPSPDLFYILPFAEELLTAMLSFSLVGFHTQSYSDNFLRCVAGLKNVTIEGNNIHFENQVCTVGVFPIGIDPAPFEFPHASPPPDVMALMSSTENRKLVLGVERLDYTKGLLCRLRCIHSLFEHYPHWRRKVCFLQVCVPSRTDVEEYRKLRTMVEALVGKINGEFSDLDWTPVRLIMHGFPPSTLACLYAASDVMLVTPNRDGMNLVAMEYVAAQNPLNPGVLLLSRFAGIATLFADGLLTNPYDQDGMTRDLDRALSLSQPARLKIHHSLLKVVKFHTAKRWGETFMAALVSGADGKHAEPTSAILSVDTDLQQAMPSAFLRRVQRYIYQLWAKLTFDPESGSSCDPKVVTCKSLVYIPQTEDFDQVVLRMTQKSCQSEIRVFDSTKINDPDFEHGLLYVPHPYVVPGGRFGEMYGWDTYFIILGLLRDDLVSLAKGIVDNLCYEIEHYGMILNCNRTWAAQRSQPPLLGRMALAVFEYTKDKVWLRGVLGYLEKSYRRWTAPPYLIPEIGLSRYYAFGEGPAPEVVHGERDAEGRSHYDRVCAYFRQHDVNCNVKQSYNRETNSLTPGFYKADRSMRESGFDPSNVFGPFCCEITSYVPICLNSLLYQLEVDIAYVYSLLEQGEAAQEWKKLAAHRVTLIDKYLWDQESGLYSSYNFVTKRRRHYPFLTTFYPLWAGFASREQALAVKGNLHIFETLGGLLTSTEVSGCQWDAPFGFAPMMYFAVMGLSRYKFNADARRVAWKFVSTVAKGFEKHGVLFEKYNVKRGSAKMEDDLAFGYTSNEIGFGWTNGIFQEFLAKFQFV